MPGFCPLPPEELAGGGDGRWNGEDTPNKVIQDSDVRKCLDIWKKRKLLKKKVEMLLLRVRQQPHRLVVFTHKYTG